MPLPQFLRNRSRLSRHVLPLAGLGLVFSLLGPFGTFSDLAAPVRFAYWYGLLLFGYLAIVLFDRALLPVTQEMRVPTRIALLTMASALPTTFAVAWVESLARLGQVIAPQVMPRLYASVAVVQLLMVLIQHRGRRAPPEPAPVADAVPLPSPFLARIPRHLGMALLAVSSEDHYLRIHTSAGSDLILMRMGDALSELAAEDGLQVHRSWWVRRDAVREVRRSAARTELVLDNGQVVPVSRSCLPAVRATDWPALSSPVFPERV
jgi:DNA-binding LytR/AlgR family response regulator